ncbi:MAG: 4-hydroxy-tetrahydrodipicolinate reductase [Sphingobium sp.]
MTAIGIIGSQGRMGQTIRLELAAQDIGCAGGVDRSEGDLPQLVGASDVLIDFSAPDALKSNLEACMVAGKPIVIGTTGLEVAHHHLIDAAAQNIAVLQTGNTSLGVNLLSALIEETGRRLGDDWDIEIVEMHHRHKIDAPSGTALLFGEAAARGRDIELAQMSERGRNGITGPRKRGTIGFASLRGGSVAGDHSAIFATDGESITLSHRAENRVIFARGAIKAARWLASQAPGRYDMKNVLGL